LPRYIHSTTIQAKAAAAAAVLVTTKALTASAPEATALPELNPNHPNQSKDAPKTPPTVEIDIDGMDDRVVAFPVPEGIYTGILGTKNRVLFTSVQPEGSLDMSFMDTGEPSAKAQLQAWSFDEDKVETVVERCTSFELSRDGKALAVRVVQGFRSFGEDGGGTRAVEPALRQELRERATGQSRAAPTLRPGWLEAQRRRTGPPTQGVEEGALDDLNAGRRCA
jgi:hypothetical protein